MAVVMFSLPYLTNETGAVWSLSRKKPIHVGDRLIKVSIDCVDAIFTGFWSDLRTALPKSSSQPVPAYRPNHAT